jgi:uncharacterized protein (TIGR02117 family)
LFVKTLKWLALGAMLIVTGMVAGVVVPRTTGSAKGSVTEGGTHLVLVLSNPIHTDIALLVEGDILSRFRFLRDGDLDIDNPGVRYLVFGRGGRSFYTETPTWADLKPMPLLKGITLDSAVMHVALAGEIPLTHADVTALALSGENYRRLVEFILAGFARDDGKEVPLAGTSYGDDDAFFEAAGYFTAVMGCNTWTAAALREAGLATGWWTPLPGLLTSSLELHNDRAAFFGEGLQAGR